MTETTSRYMVHPGEILRVWMKSNRVDEYAAAKAAGLHPSQLDKILSGHHFTNDLVVRLAKATGFPATTLGDAWQRYRSDRAQYANSIRAITSAKEMDELLPLQFMDEDGAIWVSTGVADDRFMWKRVGIDWNFSTEQIFAAMQEEHGRTVFAAIDIPHEVFER